jgi:hypothetical protein
METADFRRKKDDDGKRYLTEKDESEGETIAPGGLERDEDCSRML